MAGAAHADMFLASKPFTVRFGVEADHPGSLRIDDQHADLEVPYRAGGSFAPFVNADDDGNHPFDQAHYYANPGARINLPSIPPGFEFIGAQPNQDFWVLPQTQDPGVLFLGVAAESMSPGDLGELVAWNPGDPRHGANVSNLWLELRLVAARGPADGQFSVWQTSGGGQPVVYYSTFDGGITAQDKLFQLAGSHDHFNWAFTRSGLWEIDFQLRSFTSLSWLGGDANLDGRVNLADFNALAGSFGQLGDWSCGDFNGDGVVNLADFNILAGNFGVGGAGGESLPASVPEPAAGAVLAGLFGTLFLQRRRKMQNSKFVPAAAAAGLVALTSAPLTAQVRLETGHVEVGVGYDSVANAWDLHIHDVDNDIEYEPDEAIFVGLPGTETVVPNDPDFAFLGNPGDRVFILPQAQDPNLIYLGIAGEELPSGVFQNELVRLTLDSFSGPGQFALYETDAFGDPTVFMNTRDGIGPGDGIDVGVGDEIHLNWAFSQPGVYELGFVASSTLLNGQPTSSDLAVYTVEIVPEPAAASALGAAVFLLRRRRRGG
jgi:surface-anchored protein